MTTLILGLVIFLGIHSARVFAEGPRQAFIARHGANAWKGLYSVASLAGFVLVVWGFGIWQVSQREITVGVLVAFLAYIGRFYARLGSMSRIVPVTQKAAAAAKRIFDILDHVSSVPEPTHPVHIGKASGAIELRDVSFRYGTRTILQDISLTIAPGEMIGLVGHSGSGKSTLVNLVCRFYDPTKGRVTIDGVPLTEDWEGPLGSMISSVLRTSRA